MSGTVGQRSNTSAARQGSAGMPLALPDPVNLKILWVKPGKLLPLDSGGKLRTFNILRQLAATHDLSYLSYYDGARDESYEQAILEYFPRTTTVHTGLRGRGSVAKRIDYLRGLASPAPYSVGQFTHRKVQRLLSSWMADGRFDVVVCDFLASALNFPRRLKTPVVLFQHNVESLLWQRRASHETGWLNRVVSRVEYEKMRRLEPAQVRRFHHVVAVSEQDAAALVQMSYPGHVTVVPTGVDLTTFRHDPDAVPEGPLVVFTGSMDWQPNIDGVEYFCRDVWPSVVARVPGAKLRIVGRSPDPRVQGLTSASVEVTGSVPSVVDHLRAAAVLVVPLRIGGGTRIKIYEGMAIGKATVSTTLGAEGLDVRHGHDIVLADSPSAFGDAVVDLLRDPALRRRFETAAAATAGRYDWSVIAGSFADVLKTVVQARVMVPAASHPEPVSA
jgi:glycosyltransferase involved in cell wall biosynthesis